MNREALFKSDREDWETPHELYAELDKEFHFTLDPCSNDSNYKCKNHFTKEQDGLAQTWGGQRVFCNPPYGRQIAKWVRKAYEEAKKPNTLVVMLIPARTDTTWFHDYIYGQHEVRFLRGRLKFVGAMFNAPFPSMIVVMDH